MNISEGGQAAKPSMCSSLLQDFQSIDLCMQRVFWKIMTLCEFRNIRTYTKKYVEQLHDICSKCLWKLFENCISMHAAEY